MKIIILLLFPFFLSGQNKAEIFDQIEQAENFEDMPTIKIVTMRKADRIGRKLADFNTLQHISKGDTLTMYFPIRIYDSGNWTRAYESYNYIVLEPEMNQQSKIVNQNIILHLDKENRNLLNKWLFKYQQLGKRLQREMFNNNSLR